MSGLCEPGYGESNYMGVARKRGSKKWRAQIQLHLGSYDTEQEAGEIYVRARQLFRCQAIDLRRTYGDLRDD